MIAQQLISFLGNDFDVGYINDISRSISIYDISEDDAYNEIVYSVSMSIRKPVIADIHKEYYRLKQAFENTITLPAFTYTGDAGIYSDVVYNEKKHCRCYFTGLVTSGQMVGLGVDGKIVYAYEIVIRSSKIVY